MQIRDESGNQKAVKTSRWTAHLSFEKEFRDKQPRSGRPYVERGKLGVVDNIVLHQQVAGVFNMINAPTAVVMQMVVDDSIAKGTSQRMTGESAATDAEPCRSLEIA